MTLSFIEAMHLSQLFAFSSFSHAFSLVPVLYSSVLPLIPLSHLLSVLFFLPPCSLNIFILSFSAISPMSRNLPLFTIENKLYALLLQNEYTAIWYLSYDISKITSIHENNIPCNEFITRHSKQRGSSFFVLVFQSQAIRTNLKCIVIWWVVVTSTCIINNKINLSESINQKLVSIKIQRRLKRRVLMALGVYWGYIDMDLIRCSDGLNTLA